MKLALILVPTKDFHDPDVKEVAAALKYEGVEPVVTATAWRCEGALGTIIAPHLLAGSITVHDYDALVIVGGVGARDLATEVTAVELVRDFGKARKMVAALGNGVNVLAAAGLIKDRFVTAPATDRHAVEGKGAQFIPEPLVADGRLITADVRSAREVGLLLARLV